MEFLGSNIISINQFKKDDVELIFETANKLIPFANRSKLTKVLDGAILSNMFLSLAPEQGSVLEVPSIFLVDLYVKQLKWIQPLLRKVNLYMTRQEF